MEWLNCEELSSHQNHEYVVAWYMDLDHCTCICIIRLVHCAFRIKKKCASGFVSMVTRCYPNAGLYCHFATKRFVLSACVYPL